MIKLVHFTKVSSNFKSSVQFTCTWNKYQQCHWQIVFHNWHLAYDLPPELAANAIQTLSQASMFWIRTCNDYLWKVCKLKFYRVQCNHINVIILFYNKHTVAWVTPLHSSLSLSISTSMSSSISLLSAVGTSSGTSTFVSANCTSSEISNNDRTLYVCLINDAACIFKF